MTTQMGRQCLDLFNSSRRVDQTDKGRSSGIGRPRGIQKLEGEIMSINRVAVLLILVLLTFTANIQAQTPAAAQPSAVSSVTGSITPEGTVRMIAHGEALQIRMEVYSAAGELVADTGLR